MIGKGNLDKMLGSITLDMTIGSIPIIELVALTTAFGIGMS